ncbi:MAG TPA: sulfate/molybdate ABC transporter ATP-binding protein [Phycisphaerae bacterium]|nr:sulfate/molybdate ABC transporter ATP-binding protein [Phycisphaerae bacterium]
MSIVAKNITKRFGNFTALDDVTLEAPGGKLVALLGPSGSGKTTLLRIIAGLEFADSGRVLFEGEDATELSARHRDVGFVFQHYALFRHMSIFENIAFPLRVRKKSKEIIDQKVNELLELVQLDGMGKRYPTQLSGGQRQRIALARALAAEPKVLLLDEPFGALDAKVRKELRRWLRKLHDDKHLTSLFVTHDQEEALEVADEVVIFNKGRVEQVGTPDEVYNRPASPFVLGFLGHVNIFHGRMQDGTAQFADGTIADRRGESVREGAIAAYVRPHEIDLVPAGEEAELNGNGALARITWVHRVGATVKVEVEVEGNGQIVVAEMPREKYLQLSLERGQRVMAVPRDVRIFSTDYQI